MNIDITDKIIELNKSLIDENKEMRGAIDRLRTELKSLKSKHEVLTTFYNLTIKERDYERIVSYNLRTALISSSENLSSPKSKERGYE